MITVHGDYHRQYTHSIHVQTVLTQRRGHLSLSKLWSAIVYGQLYTQPPTHRRARDGLQLEHGLGEECVDRLVVGATHSPG